MDTNFVSAKFITEDGTVQWLTPGNALHRDPADGPAVVHPDGRTEHWVDGKRQAPWAL